MDNIIKRTENFQLEKADYENYEIYFLFKEQKELLTKVYKFANDIPSMIFRGTGLQDCVTTFDRYKEFIMLVDEAYDLLAGYGDNN